MQILRGAEDGLHINAVKWGWAPFSAKGKRPDPINARVGTVATGKFFKQLWPNGRAIVPANGWYEWVKDPADPKKKQPYYIRLEGEASMFFAGLDLEPHEGDGFVITTDASDAGIVDIHDRRPMVPRSEEAREWLELDLPAERAKGLARISRAVGDFEGYAVGRQVGDVRIHGSDFIEPLDEAS